MSYGFNRNFKIGGQNIGFGCPTYIIAEIGSNHNQNIQQAKAMIEAAKEAGADAVKFQSLRYDKVHIPEKYSEDYKKFFAQIEFDEAWHSELSNYCNLLNIHFFSSVTYLESVDLLQQVDAPVIKIASAQFDIFPEIIERAAKTGKPLIMSSGLTDLGGVERMLRLVSACENQNIVLLHCVTEYPTRAERVNLRLIQTYQQAFGCLVGYSDHTMGIHIPSAAVALGASVIEKHMTLDRNMPGPDHHYAILPDEFAKMVESIRETEKALGDGVKPALNAQEQKQRELFLYKWMAVEDLSQGELIDVSKLVPRRVPGGIPMDATEHMKKHQLAHRVEKGRVIEWSDLEYVDEEMPCN